MTRGQSFASAATGFLRAWILTARAKFFRRLGTEDSLASAVAASASLRCTVRASLRAVPDLRARKRNVTEERGVTT